MIITSLIKVFMYETRVFTYVHNTRTVIKYVLLSGVSYIKSIFLIVSFVKEF